MQLGTIEVACIVIGQVTRKTTGDESTIDDELDFSIIRDVDPQFQEPVLQILTDFKKMFATKNSQLGSTDLIKHSIDTQGRGPIRQRPYRHPRSHTAALKRQLSELKKAGIVESTSAWAPHQ